MKLLSWMLSVLLWYLCLPVTLCMVLLKSMQLDVEVLEKFKREAAMHQNERWEEM